MRNVIFGGANTLDNYIAGKDDSIDWIRHTEEVNDIMRDYWKRIDTVIMGRRTWEIAMKGGSGGGSAAAVAADGARLRVYGIDPAWGRAHLERSGVPEPPGIEWPGMVPATEFRAALREARVLAAGARWEDFGQAPLDPPAVLGEVTGAVGGNMFDEVGRCRGEQPSRAHGREFRTVPGSHERQRSCTFDDEVGERHAPDGLPLPGARGGGGPDVACAGTRDVMFAELVVQLHDDRVGRLAAVRHEARVVAGALLGLGQPAIAEAAKGLLGRRRLGRGLEQRELVGPGREAAEPPEVVELAEDAHEGVVGSLDGDVVELAVAQVQVPVVGAADGQRLRSHGRLPN